MRSEFFAQADPTLELRTRVAALAPGNPFCTPAYLEARRGAGVRPWVLGLVTEGDLVDVCLAFLRTDRASRTLEIPSLPEIRDPEAFWEQLFALCRREKVTYLELDTYGSPHVQIPRVAGETERTDRWEYVLGLQESDFWSNVHAHHRRLIQRANRHQLEIRHTVDERACVDHVTLMSASVTRRRSRGEDAPAPSPPQVFAAYVQQGAGKIVQAVKGDRILSSALVLNAEQGAYYQSAGTSAEGMACGASHFLIAETARTLQQAGVRSFNLGGTRDPGSGLARFKSRFGARIVKLEAVQCDLGSGAAGAWLRRLAPILRRALTLLH